MERPRRAWLATHLRPVSPVDCQRVKIPAHCLELPFECQASLGHSRQCGYFPPRCDSSERPLIHWPALGSLYSEKYR
uniref:Uncharacterized protein n=1 Tax=Aegilops tauschii subsp. strangulata TaxID=200361 RepID=A0A453BGF8_AEGTS